MGGGGCPPPIAAIRSAAAQRIPDMKTILSAYSDAAVNLLPIKELAVHASFPFFHKFSPF